MGNLQQNTASSGGVSLVTLPIYEPVPNCAASSLFDPDTPIDSDGVIIQKKDSSENRALRYQRQSVARQLLPKNKVFGCLRSRVDSTQGVDVFKSSEHGKCHFSNLMVCGRIWDCPVCAAKISERRRLELTSAVEQQKALGGSVLLITFTYSHHREDVLADLLDKQSKAMQWFYRHRDYKNIKADYMKKGRVRALEVNHGDANGWHPHIHELWFLDLELQEFNLLKERIYDLWVKACDKFALGTPSWEHGVDVRGGGDAASYISKFGLEEKSKGWSIEAEITKSHIKNGRNGSRSPFQLLDDHLDGDKRSGFLFVEYSEAFFRKQQLVWSKGLKSQFDLTDIKDEELAAIKEDKAVLVSTIEPGHWKIIKQLSTPRYDHRFIVLSLAENGGADVMEAYIVGLVERFKQSH